MTREQAEELARLYQERDELNRCIEAADSKNFWLGFIGAAVLNFPQRSAVVESLGGAGDTAHLLMTATGERFAELRNTINARIEQLGGEP